MKVLLVTWIDKLKEKLEALSPELEYCAIVVDNVEPAKEVLEQVGLSQELIHPLDELKACADSLSYDYALCIQDRFYDSKISRLYNSGLPTEKVVGFAALPGTANWQTERQLRYYREHFQEFEIFATGTSTVETAIDVKQFKRKAINFATSSQDFYYNFQIAKHVILCGGHNTIRYALIGLAPYSFHFDLSRTLSWKSRLLPYFIAFNDLHNLPVPVDTYKRFLREEWLTQKPSIAKVNINGVKSEKRMTQKDIDSNSNIFHWQGKCYPETCNENVKILDDYLTLCEENNVLPVMIRVLVSERYIESFNKQLLEEFDVLVEKACQKHSSAVFFDGWKLQGFTYEDFYNHGHLNRYGAAKFSTYLNDFIESL